jgi:2-dehydro-3-deoxy-D-arabinonate dehydratase
MRLYRTGRGGLLDTVAGPCELRDLDWDEVFRQPDPSRWLREMAAKGHPAGRGDLTRRVLLPPIGSQEVWAAGVTYYRSRDARMEEAAEAGGGDFYARVYSAPRPELFFKASPHRVVGPGQPVRIRRDSRWNVPEPELTLCVTAAGRIFGYTIGNDMSSRDIEGENPLYLPQAKVYDGCCALGPCILVSDEPLPPSTDIVLVIRRGGGAVFEGATRLDQMKRKPQELVEYLFRQSSFPAGCFLLTGTGIVPPNDFTLLVGDDIEITIEPIGTLRNVVA